MQDSFLHLTAKGKHIKSDMKRTFIDYALVGADLILGGHESLFAASLVKPKVVAVARELSWYFNGLQ